MLRIRTISTIGVALALAAPATAGAQQDLRSPDTREAAAVATAGRDLRSPDTRDAATRVTPSPAPDPVEPATSAPQGFEWADAGIGAAGMLGIVIAASGITLLVFHQRRRDHVSVARR